MNRLLVSILVATVAIPVIAARHRSPRRGMFWMLLLLLLFNSAYLMFVTHVFTLAVPEWFGQ
jgi:hypothetical protein